MDKTQRKKEWLDRTTRYRESRFTLKAWCDQNQISFNQMKYWIRKLSSKSEKQNNTNFLNLF